MPFKVISIVAISLLIYVFFVYQGAKKKYEIDNINKVLEGFGLSTPNLGQDTFELFQIGIGLKKG